MYELLCSDKSNILVVTGKVKAERKTREWVHQNSVTSEVYKREKRDIRKNCHVVFVGGCDGSGCRVSQVCSSNPFISLPVSLGIHTNPNWRRNRTHYITNEWWWWLLWWRRYESKNVFLLTCKNNVHPVYINILKLLNFSRKVSSYMAS